LPGTDEQADVLEYTGLADPYSLDAALKAELHPVAVQGDFARFGQNAYGSLKVMCEREANAQFPDRTLVIRPGYMVGPGDPQWRFTYWLARLEKGGDVLAPGDPLQQVQFIDVRDVAKWVIGMAERGETGVYNALGPATSMSMGEMLGGIRSLFSVPMKLTWVSIPWIGRQDIIDDEALSWSIWRFSRDDAINSDKSYASGLVCRPLHTTSIDTLAWYQGLRAELQSGVQTGWMIGEGGAARAAITPWSEIMAREEAILTRWRAHTARKI
jgi:2'-hydroxyisoflavone reductase